MCCFRLPKYWHHGLVLAYHSRDCWHSASMMHLDNCPVRPHCPRCQARLDLPTTWETEISHPSHLLTLEGQCLREWHQRKMNRHLMNLTISMGSTLSLGDDLLSYLPSHRVPFHASREYPTYSASLPGIGYDKRPLAPACGQTGQLSLAETSENRPVDAPPTFKCWFGGRTMRNTDTMMHALRRPCRLALSNCNFRLVRMPAQSLKTRSTHSAPHQCEESSQSACRRICITGNAAQAPAECE